MYSVLAVRYFHIRTFHICVEIHVFRSSSTIFYETSSYEPHELLGFSAASTRDQMPSTRDHLPETRFVLFYAFFADKNRIAENRPLCVALDPCERTKWHGHRNANNSREHIQISAAFDSCEHLRKHGDELTQLLGRVKKNISWSQSNSLCYDSARTQNRHTCDAFCDTLTSKSFPRDECRN